VLSGIPAFKKEFGYGAIVSIGYHYLQNIGKVLCEAIGGSIYAHFINSRGYVCIPDTHIFVIAFAQQACSGHFRAIRTVYDGGAAQRVILPIGLIDLAGRAQLDCS
jgi:hypothetical protein